MAYKIYVDQGHNPVNPNAGAEGNGLREQDLVYTVGILLGALLEENGNFEVRLSRPDPTAQIGSSNTSSLRARTEEANQWGADYFISLHANASTISSASGSEALVYRSPSVASRLGSAILIGLNGTTGLADRGVLERPGLYILRKTAMPAVLLELGFITNPRDAALMNTEPEAFARGIYTGILEFLEL